MHRVKKYAPPFTAERIFMPGIWLVTVKLSVSINESLPEIELAEAKFLSKEAFSIG